MEIKTLKDTDDKIILDAFNQSFSDYFVPFHLTLAQLKMKMKLDKTNLEYSVGVFENEQLIGFILHGFDIINDKRVIYNGGTGVVPEKRGKGSTQKMYDFIIPLLKKEQIDFLILEVISQNVQAIKSYKRVGYNITRELNCYKGQINNVIINNNIKIKELRNYDWSLLESFWNISPTWQHSKNVMNESKEENKSLGAFIQDKLIAYIIYNPKGKRIQQIAVDHKFRRKKIASSMIKAIIDEFDKNLSMINVDSTDKALNQFLQNIGLENYLTQLEMKMELG